MMIYACMDLEMERRKEASDLGEEEGDERDLREWMGGWLSEWVGRIPTVGRSPSFNKSEWMRNECEA